MSSGPGYVALVREVEERASDAWPAAEVVECCGWRLRATEGVTRRANSAWPNADTGTLSLTEKLERAETFYRQRGLRPCFQLCPASVPEELDDLLAARGYEVEAPVCVQTALLAPLHEAPPRPDVQVEIASDFDDTWLAAYCEAEGVSPAAAQVRAAILRRIAAPVGFASAWRDGELVSVALGVASGDWMGLFNIATPAAHRRQGFATAAIRSLAGWAAGCGASRTYLQVMETNAVARSLYARLGFETLYRYHYRVQSA